MPAEPEDVSAPRERLLSDECASLMFRRPNILVFAPDRAAEKVIQELRLNHRVAGRVQVLSVTKVPVFPQVECGAFLDALYYRLNVIYLVPRVAATPPRPATRPRAAGRV